MIADLTKYFHSERVEFKSTAHATKAQIPLIIEIVLASFAGEIFRELVIEPLRKLIKNWKKHFDNGQYVNILITIQDKNLVIDPDSFNDLLFGENILTAVEPTYTLLERGDLLNKISQIRIEDKKGKQTIIAYVGNKPTYLVNLESSEIESL